LAQLTSNNKLHIIGEHSKWIFFAVYLDGSDQIGARGLFLSIKGFERSKNGYYQSKNSQDEQI
jgi:hypothetical protein